MATAGDLERGSQSTSPRTAHGGAPKFVQVELQTTQTNAFSNKSAAQSTTPTFSEVLSDEGNGHENAPPTPETLLSTKSCATLKKKPSTSTAPCEILARGFPSRF
jgi:hypothetical protein